MPGMLTMNSILLWWWNIGSICSSGWRLSVGKENQMLRSRLSPGCGCFQECLAKYGKVAKNTAPMPQFLLWLFNPSTIPRFRLPDWFHFRCPNPHSSEACSHPIISLFSFSVRFSFPKIAKALGRFRPQVRKAQDLVGPQRSQRNCFGQLSPKYPKVAPRWFDYQEAHHCAQSCSCANTQRSQEKGTTHW